MNYIDVLPQIRNGIFFAHIKVSGNIPEAIIRVTARKNDGTYKTEIMDIQKDPNFSNDEGFIKFFAISKSLIAQIVSVRINGVEAYVSYTDINEDLKARYDDSITRISWTENMNNIKLDFDVIGSNPMNLLVVDKSEWGILGDRPAIVEISYNHNESKTFYLGKNQVNVFDSNTLDFYENEPQKGLRDAREFKPLPDGLYSITIIGSPSDYIFSRDYLKTDMMRLWMDRLWADAYNMDEQERKERTEKIKEVEFLILAAEAHMRLGQSYMAEGIFNTAIEVATRLFNCGECSCMGYNLGPLEK